MTDQQPQRKRAMLGQPGYGELTAGAAAAFWLASNGKLEVERRYNEGSLLAQNFNSLWCYALNYSHKGGRLDYFAMLHSDVEPQPGWLDELVEELEERELDVLGAVVPIKSPGGLTSIAIAREDGDPWRPACRLTMHEVFNLPATFTSEDLGGPLLINTGCWVCRFDMEWAKKVRFTINDRIVFSATQDAYFAQVEPEDWYFSRLLHEIGLRVGATRKLGLDHAGKSRFTNRTAWGTQKFDSEYVPESIIPEGDGFQFPDEITGWLLREEGKALAELCRGKRVLEVGSYCGRSTVCIARTASLVDCVDPFDGRATGAARDTLQDFLDNIGRYGVNEIVEPYQGSFAEVADILNPPYDVVFIDGAHDLESVRSDIERSMTLLSDGGVLAFHDYRTRPGEHDGGWDPGVTQAVDELLRSGGELISTNATIAVVKPPAAIPSEV